MLRTGVVRGVDRGVEVADNNPLGRVSIRLIRFSFSSGTSTIMQADVYDLPMLFL